MSSSTELFQPSSPWWVDETKALEDDHLCRVCRHINFSWLFHNELPATDSGLDGSIPLGPLDNIIQKSSCPFCRLVVLTVATALGKEKPPVTYGQRPVYCEIHTAYYFKTGNQGIYQLSIWLSSESGYYPAGEIEIQLLHHESLPYHSCFNQGRRIIGHQTDFSLIKTWIYLCDETHPTSILSEQSTTHFPVNFRVINVQRQCLVQAPPDCRYLALSYLWGTSKAFKTVRGNRPHLERDGSLSFTNDALPRTIRDALYLTAQIGERYLWIDAICIIQDDDNDKAQQIDAMGKIYGSALLTIVAAFGNDADAGLPGVYTIPRRPFQHIQRVQGMELTNMLPELLDVFNSSPWSTRAWTHQERKLSNRLLVFSGHQAYFNCEHATYREDQCLESEELRPERLSWHKNERDHRLLTRKHTNFETYVRELEQYSKRNLSYASDALKAFAGIIQLLRVRFRGGFIHGIPETAFDAGLLWYPRGHLIRRKCPKTSNSLFPSWSWAGWTGPVTYDSDNLVLITLPRVKWAEAPCSGEVRCFLSEEEANRHHDWPGWKRWKRRSDLLDHLVTCIYFIEEDEPDVWFSHPVLPPKGNLQPPSSAKDRDVKGLLFRALSAVFRITGQHNTSSFFNSEPCKRGDAEDHQVCPLAVLDTSGCMAGTVHVPGNLALDLNGVYEFVVLSRTTLTNDDDDKAYSRGTFRPPEGDDDDDGEGVARDYNGKSNGTTSNSVWFDSNSYNAEKPWCLYNVLLVQRELLLAHRVGIGKIHIDAFHQSQPVEKEILLE